MALSFLELIIIIGMLIIIIGMLPMTRSDMMRGMATRHKMMGWVLNLLNGMGIPLKDG